MEEELVVDNPLTADAAREITRKALNRSLSHIYHQIQQAAQEEVYTFYIEDPMALTEPHVKHLKSRGFDVWQTGSGWWRWMRPTGWLISWEKKDEDTKEAV